MVVLWWNCCTHTYTHGFVLSTIRCTFLWDCDITLPSHIHNCSSSTLHSYALQTLEAITKESCIPQMLYAAISVLSAIDSVKFCCKFLVRMYSKSVVGVCVLVLVVTVAQMHNWPVAFELHAFKVPQILLFPYTCTLFPCLWGWDLVASSPGAMYLSLFHDLAMPWLLLPSDLTWPVLPAQLFSVN